ncbi:hypothetical protein BST81_01505 [Leptolyngbya sp. 'hensonii']|uniref:hypothetical protein n=1 Tax=Leptolyngbya sp. 'hensonii' TaxID=1922337 RepID=UPI00095018A2|nr:hypothetical protein [Leptolyngbya sp. 'hensonii']OLP20138.1 hypothetical protein BST81_01505 [Leptolyngbya sp. 'hensonii']
MTNTNNPQNQEGCFKKALQILAGAVMTVVIGIGANTLVKLIENGTIKIPDIGGPMPSSSPTSPAPTSPTPTSSESPKSYELTGVWEADVTEFGKRTQIIWTIQADNTSSVQLVIDSRVQPPVSYTWQYLGDVLMEKDSIGNDRKSRIEWKASNNFEQTILEDQISEFKGLKRNFYRR